MNTDEGCEMKFSPKAFTEMIDLNGEGFSWEHYCQAVRDIRQTYHRVWAYERGIREEDVRNKIRPVPKRRFPFKICVEQLSDCLLPISRISEVEGVFKIAVNRNFVLFLHLLLDFGFDGPDGDMYDGPLFEPLDGEEEDLPDYAHQKLGNFYRSLLFATAIHDIRGNFLMDKNGVRINMDRTRARGQWGGRHRFVNLAAMTYFWLAVVQGYPCSFSPEEKSFIRNNPDVYRELEKEQLDRLDEVLFGFSFSMTFQEKLPCLENLPRVPVLSHAGLFQALRERGGTLTEISSRLGLDDSVNALITVRCRLKELIDLGMARAVHFKKSKVVGLMEYKQHFRNSEERILYLPGRIPPQRQINPHVNVPQTPSKKKC